MMEDRADRPAETRRPGPLAGPGLRARRRLGWVLLPLLLLGPLPEAGAQEEVAEEPQYALQKPLAQHSLLLDGAAADGLLVAVGERGHILVSRDQGESWRQAAVPTRATLTGVFFHDRELGWAVGHDAVILRTRDGGENWELLYRAPEEERPLLDVWFADAEHGFAIGAYSFFLVTRDGGDTWSSTAFEPAEGPSGGGAGSGDGGDEGYWGDEDAGDYEDYEEYDDYELEVEYHLNQLARSEAGRLYIAAEAGTIYRSDDGGASWTSLPSPYEGSFFGTLPLAGDSLLLFGLRGHLFRSDDAGASWRAIETGTTAMLTDARVLRDGRIVIVGLAGTVLVSRDGGQTFVLRQQADRQGLATVLEADGGSLVLIGEYGVTRLPLAALDEGASP